MRGTQCEGHIVCLGTMPEDEGETTWTRKLADHGREGGRTFHLRHSMRVDTCCKLRPWSFLGEGW